MNSIKLRMIFACWIIIPLTVIDFFLIGNLNLSSIFVILGFLFNLSAVSLNGWKMGALIPKGHILQNTKYLRENYKFYTWNQRKKIRLWYLSDVYGFKIKTKNGLRHLRVSVGDILLVSGIIISIINIFL